MINLVRSIGAVVAASALAASPVLADEGAQHDQQDPQGQPGQQDPQGQQIQQNPQGQQGQQYQQGQSPQGQQGQQYQQGRQGQMDPHGKITKKTKLNQRISFPVSNGCTYTAEVKGTVAPVQTSGSAEMVDPDIRVDASLACPAGTKKITQKLSHPGPMTVAALEDAMERGATFLSDEPGRTCVFRPDFSFSQDKLAGLGVAYLCAIGAQGASNSP